MCQALFEALLKQLSVNKLMVEIIIPIYPNIQMKKLRIREVELVSQGQTTSILRDKAQVYLTPNLLTS